MSKEMTNTLQSKAEWIGIRKANSKDDPPMKLLDYACGNGLVSRALIDQVDSVTGIDISKGMVDEYNRLAKEAGYDENRMHAAQGDVMVSSGPEFEAIKGDEYRRFAFVAMSMALHHVADPASLLKKLVDERLKSGGTLIIIDLAPSNNPAGNHGHHHAHSHGDGDGHGSNHGHSHGHNHAHSNASHTIAHDSFSEDVAGKLFEGAGLSKESFGYFLNPQGFHTPEEFSKAKGGLDRKYFIARATKL
jgi:SAM-dependent methyltransferase